MKPVLNIAHRGASGHAPENTLAAFQTAVEMGAHMIELDLHLSLDNELVVIHDRSLKRTTGSRGSVDRSTFKEIRTLDAGSWFNERYRGEQVPILEEVLERVGPHARLNVEIKKGLRAYPSLERRLLTCLEGHGQHEQPLISSFDETTLQRVRRLDKSIPIGYLFERGSPGSVIRRALKFGAVSVHGSTRAVSKELIGKAHAEGLKVYVYTVNEEEEMRRWISLGVDGVFTNYPDRLTAVLRMT